MVDGSGWRVSHLPVVSHVRTSVRDVGRCVVLVGWEWEIWKRDGALVQESVGDDNSCGMTSIVVGRVVIADVSR